MKKGLIWKILMVIGLCPLITPFFYYFLQQLVHNDYPWTLIEMLILWSFLYWPTYLIGLVILGISLYKLKK